ncbi:hypothetical protein L7F22_017359 [Adiantum nelumboides]|nr:hypothetical protein [Adiantum nelumboides]
MWASSYMALARCCAVGKSQPAYNIFCWPSPMNSYQNFCHEGVLILRDRAHMKGFQESQHTYASRFKACLSIPTTLEGRVPHHLAQQKGRLSDAFVGTALVNMYSKFGDIVKVEGVFQKMIYLDIIAWTAMLTAYVEHDMAERALQLFCQMQAEGSTPDDRVFVISIQACGILAEQEPPYFVEGQAIKIVSLEIGQALHADARKFGYASNVYVGTTLISMYGKCGAISDAEDAFSALSQRNVVTWNAMLTAYVEQRLGEKALYLYWTMLRGHVPFDDITLICILQACCETGNLDACKQIHFHIESVGYHQDPSVASTLIHSYGNCGGTKEAEASFVGLLAPDVVSWSASIAGHAGKGEYSYSVELFEKMQLVGIQPNEITFSSLLTACSHAGLIAEGLDFFNLLSQKALIVPDLKHYNCMIDLFGRAGNFKRLEYMLGKMPIEGDLTFWLCLLCVCRIHCNVETAKQAFDHAISLHPNYPAAYIMLANIYADSGLQERAAELKSVMQKLGIEEAWQEVE